MVQLSTGDMLRAAKTSGTEIGKRVAEVMARGDLVTDDIVIGLISEQLDGESGRHGLIFDGFPRTLAQADALEALMAAKGKFLDAVIEMRVEDEVLIERISGRFTCSNCGEVYHDTAKPTAKAGVCDQLRLDRLHPPRRRQRRRGPGAAHGLLPPDRAADRLLPRQGQAPDRGRARPHRDDLRRDQEPAPPVRKAPLRPLTSRPHSYTPRSLREESRSLYISPRGRGMLGPARWVSKPAEGIGGL